MTEEFAQIQEENGILRNQIMNVLTFNIVL